MTAKKARDDGGDGQTTGRKVAVVEGERENGKGQRRRGGGS